MNLKGIFKIKYNFLNTKILINILKIILFYILIRFKDFIIINNKKIIEIDNKVNESLYENNLDFFNYTTPIKIISIYYPEFLNISNNFINLYINLNESTLKENIISLHDKSYKEIKDDKNFYYLNKTSNLELIKNQVNLAKNHNIYGFAFYYYWFSGKKIFNEAINIFLESKEIDIYFLIIWKNNNYELNINKINKILIKQEYKENDPINLINDIKKYLISEKYIKINEKPVLGIYNYSKILQIKNFINNLRKASIEIRIGELYILGNFNEIEDYYKIKIFNFNFEFPSININLNKLFNYKINCNYSDLIYNNIYLNNNYNIFENNIYELDKDNINNTFFDFYEYFEKKLYILYKILFNWTNINYKENIRFIFINGWNNYINGQYLEPDKKYGYSSLNILSKSLFNLPIYKNNFNIDNLINRTNVAVQAHIFYNDLIFDIINKTNNIPVKFDLLISTTSKEISENILKNYIKYSKANKYEIILIKNIGRDIFPLLYQLKNNFKRYKYLCHIHTKKSLTSPEIGINWRNYLYNNLLGNTIIVKEILSDFENIDKLGFIFPETYHEIIKESLLLTKITKKYMQYILNKLFYNYKIGNKLIFPAGNMFWARINAIYQIFEYDFNLHYFKEKNLTNDSIIHGIERIWLYLVKINGYYYKKIFKLI